jgi:hypothetical protein
MVTRGQERLSETRYSLKNIRAAVRVIQGKEDTFSGSGKASPCVITMQFELWKETRAGLSIFGIGLFYFIQDPICGVGLSFPQTNGMDIPLLVVVQLDVHLVSSFDFLVTEGAGGIQVFPITTIRMGTFILAYHVFVTQVWKVTVTH